MRYWPKSALWAAGVLTAATALARMANGQGVVRTPAVIRAQRCSVISIYSKESARISKLSLKNLTGDAQLCTVALPGSMGAVWSGSASRLARRRDWRADVISWGAGRRR